MTANARPQNDPLLYWEDFREGEVREFGSTTIKHDDIVRFASEFDPQPFHIDDAAAAKALKTIPVGRVPHSVVVDD